MDPYLSVVIPVYNEEDSLAPLQEALDSALKAVGGSFEVLFVDDGSTDGSLEAMMKIRENRPFVRIIRHRSNSGLSAAMATGFRCARGEIVATLDADLQNDPRDLPLLLERMDDADAAVGACQQL